MDFVKHDDLFINAFEFASIGMALVSPEGKFLKVNKSLCELLECEDDKLTSLDFQQITHPDDLQKDLALLEEVLQGKRASYQMEKRYISKSGKVVWAILSVSLIRKENGEPRFFISQIQDITELKAAQEELFHKSKFISLGQLSVKLAHEINNPLAIILLHSTGLKSLDLSSDEGKRTLGSYSDKIYAAVNRVSSIVKQLTLTASSQNSQELDDFLEIKKRG
ncbi:MAG: PAS domain S-box protein [Bacteriovoracia bacterium]